ncbi:hypothetical protein PMZ80_006294 [Knufia obscura]|uniref:Uncharacterized protein n=2 Tax=Knufia TaxID=430999 RepID=A0AAN8ELH1_9EURO|nr:hypothetical protein PMZ80_006294 [Knufia obscura]KAK5953562.1 hypothetical protein OHC33_005506 [Knufia fluminis]
MPASVEYITNPADATFDYESDPMVAMSSYSKMMHQHTTSQMEQSCRSLRRKSAGSHGVDAHVSLPKDSSLSSSTSSRSSF